MNRFSVLDELSRGLRGYILLFCITLIAAAPGVFNIPALDRDESRFAQASKQMLETGDFITIRYQDGQRNKKPAGIHWLQTATTAMFSSADAQQMWSYRIPSWIGAALASCALFWAGIPLIGRRAAFLGSALFSVGILLTSEAHISKTDGVLVAITTLGVAALIHLIKDTGNTRPKATAILFWFAMGFGFLIKGPVTPMVAFLALAFYFLSERGWKWPLILCGGLVVLFLDTYVNLGPANFFAGLLFKTVAVLMLGIAVLRCVLDQRKEEWFQTLFWWPGPVLFVAMIIPWLIAIQLATDGQFLEGALGKDLKDKVVGASEGHGGPPGYHILYLLTHFFPATLFLIPATVQSVKAIRHKLDMHEGVLFLVAWAVPTWVLFEFLPTKLSHYVLPAYPPLALLCGYAVWKLMEGVRLPVSRYASLGLFLLGGGLIAIIASPIGEQLFMQEAAGDFRSVSSETVMEAWSVYTVTSWPLIIIFAGLLLTLFYSVLRRYQMAVLFAVISSFAIGWHIRITFLPEQTWLQATWAARETLKDICVLPGEDECELVEASQIHAIGYAEPSFVFTTGTDVRITPESSSDLPPADEAPYMAYVINLESQELGPPALEAVRAEAAEQNRCVIESEPVYALNYSNGDPVHFIGVLVGPAPCES